MQVLTVRRVLALILVLGLPGMPAAAQSPSPVPAPDCGAATTLRFPLRDAGATLVTPFAVADPTLPNPDTRFIGRFSPAGTWTYPEAAGGRAVFAAGAGRIVASGPVGAGDRGGIVVVEHRGPYLLPASDPLDPGAPYIVGATSAETILTVYAGIDPAGLPLGTCVTADSLLGTTTAQCGPGVALPCSDLPPALRLEVRLGTTADPALRSADWSVVGAAGTSIAGTFLDPQVMVDAGYRDPSQVLTVLAPPCVPPSAAPGASPAPCPPPVPVASAAPSPAPSAAPTPSAAERPMRGPAKVLLSGIPPELAPTCVRRTRDLVTGTLAAFDCRPRSAQIDLITYFLARPPDARFTFNARTREASLAPGGDCAGGIAGIEEKAVGRSSACYRNSAGRANLRLAYAGSCPGLYIGVLGRTGNIPALTAAFTEVTGGMPWTEPPATVPACFGAISGVTPPPAPTNTVLTYATKMVETRPGEYRATHTVKWSISLTTDTVIEVWGLRGCPAELPPNGKDVDCAAPGTYYPPEARILLATAPAAAGKVSFPTRIGEVMGPALFYADAGPTIGAVLVRASNGKAASSFVIPKNGTAESCLGCTW